MSKPYKGSISNWKRRHQGDKYSIVGIPHSHPDFEGWIWTSEVVKMEKTNPYTNGRDGYFTYEVETKNSHYELIGEEADKEIPCPAKNYLKHGKTPL